MLIKIQKTRAVIYGGRKKTTKNCPLTPSAKFAEKLFYAIQMPALLHHKAKKPPNKAEIWRTIMPFIAVKQ